MNDDLSTSAAPGQLDLASFDRNGFLILRHAVSDALCKALRDDVGRGLKPLVGPVEYEADVGYPGAPQARSAPGGETPRRLLHAYARSPLLRELACHPDIARTLHQLLGAPAYLSQCHHNCVMTKHPGYSSVTLWHQDIRYWSFDRPELISAWVALGDENEQNGALWVIPETHKLDLDRGRLDRDLFLRPELEANQQLIDKAIPINLSAGDVLLFHCRVYHAAGKNTSGMVKLSPVFTYHTLDNQPIPGTRSAAYPSIPVEEH